MSGSGDVVRTAEGAPLAQAAQQELQDVADGDGLDARVQPARRDHHRQLLDQIADDLERRASRTHHDPRLEGRDGNATRAQDGIDVAARLEMAGEFGLVDDPAQVQNLSNPQMPGELQEMDGRCFLQRPEILGRVAHGVDEVVGGVHRGERF